MLSDWPARSHYSETQRHISGELQVSLLCCAHSSQSMDADVMFTVPCQLKLNSEDEVEVSRPVVWLNTINYFILVADCSAKSVQVLS